MSFPVSKSILNYFPTWDVQIKTRANSRQSQDLTGVIKPGLAALTSYWALKCAKASYP